MGSFPTVCVLQLLQPCMTWTPCSGASRARQKSRRWCASCSATGGRCRCSPCTSSRCAQADVRVRLLLLHAHASDALMQAGAYIVMLHMRHGHRGMLNMKMAFSFTRALCPAASCASVLACRRAAAQDRGRGGAAPGQLLPGHVAAHGDRPVARPGARHGGQWLPVDAASATRCTRRAALHAQVGLELWIKV